MQVNIRAVVDDLKKLNNTLTSCLKWIEFKLFLDILRGKCIQTEIKTKEQQMKQKHQIIAIEYNLFYFLNTKI